MKVCVGECVCDGYMCVLMGIEFMMCLIGLLVLIFVFKEMLAMLAAGRRFDVAWASEILEEDDKELCG